MTVFYVTSVDLPTIAIFKSVRAAFTFRNMLVLKLGYQASVIKTDKEC